MKTILCALALLAASFPAFAQQNFYTATTGDVTLSGAGTSLTIQQPATNAKQVQLIAVLVYCSVACNATQAQNGTAATATAGTASDLLPLGPAAQATIWTASNVGAGTTVGGTLHLAGGAGTERTLDLSQVAMGNTGTGTNYTITVSSITGTANITLLWSEK